MLLLLTLAACARGGRGTPGVSWFQIQSGTFQPVRSPAAAEEVPKRPWTVQTRVADMAFLGDTLYCALNGWGLATIVIDAAGAAAFSYHPDSLIFSHRTITTLIPRHGTLVVHLYYNALLNDASPQELALAPLSLVTYLPAQADFSFLIPPFQKKNPDWEAVGIAPLSENQFDFEWKFTDAAETRFAYTRYSADTEQEETTSRDAYIEALGVPSISGAGVPADRAAFFDACRAEERRILQGEALQFTLRSRSSSVRVSYRSEPQSESAIVFPVFEEAGSRLALLPDARILRARGGKAPHAQSLPRLPEGFRYTDLVKAGGYLVVPWEEVSFTDVGRAGILLFPFPE